ncbi:hypothetical protein ACYG9R_26080 [Mesorhizobium sp. RSR565B]|uniref:hypothetical protein n=1 Tax=unclassified Mesorhizobium TaxID=325217 RepID=UPI0012DFB6FE|nr:hypothetical protein [Mesorhizobium sp. L103C565B0]
MQITSVVTPQDVIVSGVACASVVGVVGVDGIDVARTDHKAGRQPHEIGDARAYQLAGDAVEIGACPADWTCSCNGRLRTGDPNLLEVPAAAGLVLEGIGAGRRNLRPGRVVDVGFDLQCFEPAAQTPPSVGSLR